jgi:polyisoprenoid-binding protein YceI
METSGNNVSVVSVGQSVERSGSPKWVKVGVGLGALGLALWGLRWFLQGADTVYTDVARAFWVPGPGSIWVETTDRWVWLGLEGLGAVVAIVGGTAAMLWLAHRAKGPAFKKVATALSRVGAVFAMVAPVLPAWAFISGFPPDGAERLLPLAAAPTAPVAGAAPAGPVAALDLPVGAWTIADSSANLLVARVKAGGETLDAKFAPLTGTVDLTADLVSSKAGFKVPATSVETGVELRNSHAQGYLAADQHATIALTLARLDTVTAGPDAQTRSFTATGELAFMGKTLNLPVTGTLTVLDAKVRGELGVTAPHAILVNASFVLVVKSTALDPANFDTDQIPLTARLVLIPGGTRP